MITKTEFIQRRKAVAAQLSAEALAVIPASNEAIRSGDSHYRFRQDSNFYYLTGFNEPEALLVITSDAKSFLFNLPRDEAQEQWTGERLGQERAVATLGVDEAYPIEQVDNILVQLMQGREIIYYPVGMYPHWEKKIFANWNAVKKQVRTGIKAPTTFTDMSPILSEMRLFKSAAELASMQKAADISVQAHIQAMKRVKHCAFEYQLEAELMYAFTQEGSRSVAYDPIVAGGKNACILHYNNNDKALEDDSLILIDAGCEFDNYAADITRTFPRNGRFNKAQKALYDLVLDAQQEGIACIHPGRLWNEVQQKIVEVLTTGLVGLGILKGNVRDLIATEAYKAFYMHNSGHWLGLDVHDVGRYKIDGEWRCFEEGMVLTVEPGLYIKPTAAVDACWKGIGIRIEDDIAVTAQGSHNLTAHLPSDSKEIEDIICG